MVKPLFLTVLMAYVLSATPCFASVQVSAQLSSNVVEMGKPVTLILSTPETMPLLSTINLNELEKNFYVDRGTTTPVQPQQLQLHLYPRRPGKLRLPPLSYKDAHTKALVLNVSAGHDAKTNSHFKTEFLSSTTQAWIHQEVIYKFSIVTRDSHVVLQSKTPHLVHGSLHQLPVHSEPILHGDQNLIRHTLSWSYLPTRIGTHHIELPSVRYVRDGIVTHVFYHPQQNIEIQPLPLYVPGNISVGKLSLKINDLPYFMLTGKLYHLTLELHGSGIRQGQLPQLENYLHSQSGLKLYPVSTHHSYTSTPQGLKSQSLLHLPIKADSSGFYSLNNIDLSYFEPNAGKINTLSYHWPGVIFISPSVLGLAGLLLSVFLIHYIGKLTGYIRYLYKRRKIYQQARYHLHEAKTPHQIKQAVMLINLLHDCTDNTTLQHWHYRKMVDIRPLTQALYGEANYDIELLKQPYLHILR